MHQKQQSVAPVAGVTDGPPGFPHTLPGVDQAGSSHYPLQSFAAAGSAVFPNRDAASQDALYSAGVE